MNRSIKRCCWVLKPARSNAPAEYCGKPTKYKIVRDNELVQQREYDTLCPYHRAVDDQASKEELDCESDP